MKNNSDIGWAGESSRRDRGNNIGQKTCVDNKGIGNSLVLNWVVGLQVFIIFYTYIGFFCVLLFIHTHKKITKKKKKRKADGKDKLS